MSLDTDYIVDRRRMRRKLTFWRVLAVLIAIIGVVVIAALTRGSAELSGPRAPADAADFAGNNSRIDS